jgi:hypothetical protein
VRGHISRPAELLIALPGRAWPVERVETRRALLQGRELGSLGVRHGFAGEALYERVVRGSKDPLRELLHRSTAREALGLFALDWVPRVDWTDNPFAADDRSRRAFQLQTRHELARLLAALELHADGLPLAEVAQAFQRRTGVDASTARAEARAAQRDPLHGAGYVGMLELRGFEQRLAALTGSPRKGLGLTLLLCTRNPDLRPADMREQADRVLRARAGAEPR